MFQRLFAAETVPVLPGGASLSGASIVYTGTCFTLSVKPKGIVKSRSVLLATVFTYRHMLRCRLKPGGL